MSITQRIPLLGFALSLYTGIALASYIHYDSSLVFGFSMLLCVSSLLMHIFLKRKVNVIAQLSLSVVIYLCSFLLGLLMYDSSIESSPEKERNALVLLTDFKNKTSKSKYQRLEAKGRILNSERQSQEFGVLCYSNDINIDLGQKDFLMANLQLKPFLSPELSHHFNAKKYYAKEGIKYFAWLTDRRYVLKESNVQSLEERTSLFSQRAMRVFDSLGLEKAGVVKAMLVGDKASLHPEIKQGFINSGTVHLLVVSGLHVGVVFLMINGLLFWLKFKRIKLVLSILAIWLYVILIGCSTPAVRAAIMISLVLLGKMIGRSSYVLNSIVLSSMIIVFSNPQSLFSLSFQYSYAAVFGIIIFYPILKKRMMVQDWLLSKMISLLLVSLSAQVFTTPLGIYYFNQVPAFSIVANLIILPLMLVEFYLGIVVTLTSSILPQLNHILLWVMDAYLDVIILINQFIKNIDASTLKLPSSHAYKAIAIYLIIALFYIGWRRKNLGSTVMSLVFIGVLVLSQSKQQGNKLYTLRNKSKMVTVYIANHEAYIFGESASILDSKFYNFKLQPILINSKIKKQYRISIDLMNLQQKMGEIHLVMEGVFLHKNKLVFMRCFMTKPSIEMGLIQEMVNEKANNLELFDLKRDTTKRDQVIVM
ncbi:MAG: ComEC/Rec2 family competence protein [Bacteroidia bacterium]